MASLWSRVLGLLGAAPSAPSAPKPPAPQPPKPAPTPTPRPPRLQGRYDAAQYSLCLYWLVSVAAVEAIAQASLGKVTTGAKELKTARKSVLDSPYVNVLSVANFFSMWRAIVVNVVKFKNMDVVLSATDTASTVSSDDLLSEILDPSRFVIDTRLASGFACNGREFPASAKTSFATSVSACRGAASTSGTSFLARPEGMTTKAKSSSASRIAAALGSAKKAGKTLVAAFPIDNGRFAAIAKAICPSGSCYEPLLAQALRTGLFVGFFRLTAGVTKTSGFSLDPDGMIGHPRLPFMTVDPNSKQRHNFTPFEMANQGQQARKERMVV